MSAAAVAPLTVALGDSTLGPFSVAAGTSRYTLTLDMANLLPSLSVLMDYSPDGGQTWQPLGGALVNGPYTNKLLQLVTTLRLVVTLGAVGDPAVPVVATSTAQVRARLHSTLAFVSTGGTLEAA